METYENKKKKRMKKPIEKEINKSWMNLFELKTNIYTYIHMCIPKRHFQMSTAVIARHNIHIRCIISLLSFTGYP